MFGNMDCKTESTSLLTVASASDSIRLEKDPYGRKGINFVNMWTTKI